MGQRSFATSAALLESAALANSETSHRTLERLERIILDHKPQSAMEAVAMLDVVIPDVSIGGRSDGRDVKALISIRSMLSQC